MKRFLLKKITPVLLIVAIILPFYTPVVSKQATPAAQAIVCANCVQEATEIAREAQRIVSENLENIGISATVLNTANSFLTDNLLELKEFILDGLAYYIAELALREITRSIVNWINSGFQGSPAFVTDLEGFLLDVADREAGEFIYGSKLGFICSPFQLDVRIALTTQYAQERDFQTQCRLSEVADNIEGFLNGAFNENGGWASWFELTQNVENTPQGAYFKAKAELDVRISNAQGQEIEILNWGKGFFSFEACTEVQTARSGETPTGGAEYRTDNKENCTMTTPGSVIQEQLNETLKFGTQRLVIADEIDEIVGALLAQLTKQIITGAYGLLGLGGSNYASRGFGANGNLSYLDALGEEDTATGDTDILVRIQDSLEIQEDYLALQFEILERAEAEAEKLQRASERDDLIAGCFDLTLSSKLARAITDAIETIETAEPLEATLLDMEERLLLAETRTAEIEVANEYTELLQSRTLQTESDILVVEGFLDFELDAEIREFQTDIDDEIERCLIPPEEDEDEGENGDNTR